MVETLRALDDLVSQGNVVYPAVSNWVAWQIAKGLGISEARHWARFQRIQPMYIWPSARLRRNAWRWDSHACRPNSERRSQKAEVRTQRAEPATRVFCTLPSDF